MADKFSKKNQTNSFGRIFDEIIQSEEKSNSTPESELDFITSPHGLNIALYPVQAIIVKAAFGIDLDYKPQMVPMWDMMKENLLRTVTEKEFVHILHEEGRSNVHDWRDIPAKGFGTLCLYAGRRGGKSAVVSGIGASLLRNLLRIHNPQDYYKLIKGSTLDFSLMGTDEESSDRLYQKLRADVNGSPFFNPYIRGNTESEMTFVTGADRDNRDVVPSITVRSYPCTTRSARGPSNYFLALDEFQFFRSSKDANSSDLYKAATPSTSQFAPPDDPDTADSKIVVISSPANKIGKMYELHAMALKEGTDSGIFTMRLSTVEMNPRIPRSKLAQDLKENPETYRAEFGGEFLDGYGSFVPEIKFNMSVDEERSNQTRFSIKSVGRKYFWGLDYATKKDGTGLAIGHLEMTDGHGVELIYDYIDRMMVGEVFEGPGVDQILIPGEEKYVKYTELDVMDVIRWLVHMHQILPCYKGMTDQHAGPTLTQLLQINDITKMEQIALDQQKNSKMYNALRGFIENNLCRFPKVPKFEQEFKMLKATYVSKYVLKVEAPNEKNAHDDMSDAAAEVAWLAQTWLEEEGKLDLDPSGRILQIDSNLTQVAPVIDPNNISPRDLAVLDRQNHLMGVRMLPRGVMPVNNPFTRAPRRR